MDAALEKRQVKRAYKIYAPAYDFVFDWIFHPGREQAIRLLDLRRGDHEAPAEEGDWAPREARDRFAPRSPLPL